MRPGRSSTWSYSYSQDPAHRGCVRRRSPVGPSNGPSPHATSRNALSRSGTCTTTPSSTVCTAVYRVHRIEDLLPVPLAERRLEIHVALHLTATRAQRHPSPSRRISSR